MRALFFMLNVIVRTLIVFLAIYLIWGREGIDALNSLRERIPLAEIIMPAICYIVVGLVIFFVGVAITVIGVIFRALLAIFQALSAKRIEVIRHLLFSFRGRISRRMWCLAQLVSFFCVFLINLLAGLLAVTAKRPDVGYFLFGSGFPFFVWVELAINAKRLHDRNLSGWWQIVAAPFQLAAMFIHIRWVTSIIFVAYPIILFFVYLGCVRGDSGANGYGDPPPHSLKEWWESYGQFRESTIKE